MNVLESGQSLAVWVTKGMGERRVKKRKRCGWGEGKVGTCSSWRGEWNEIPRKNVLPLSSQILAGKLKQWYWWAHNKMDAIKTKSLPELPYPWPTGRLDSSCRAQCTPHWLPEPPSVPDTQECAANTQWISEWENTCHLTTDPRVCFYLGKANCLDKYFRVDSPMPSTRKKVKFGERVVWWRSATPGRRQTSWNSKSN